MTSFQLDYRSVYNRSRLSGGEPCRGSHLFGGQSNPSHRDMDSHLAFPCHYCPVFLAGVFPPLTPPDSITLSIHDTSATSAPSSSNLRLNLPSLPVIAPSSSIARSSDHTPVFQTGLLVVSRVSRILDRGEVVQCVNEVPSERITT